MVANNPLSGFDYLGLFLSQYHKSMTQEALTGANQKLIDAVVAADVAQDDGKYTNSGAFADPLNHGDDNLIAPTIQRMHDRLDQALKTPCPDCKAAADVLKLFGQAAHALQDLYSHSNYIESNDSAKGNTSAPGDIPLWPMIGNDGKPYVPDGVYTGNYEWPNHGPSPSHAEINKDGPNSPRGKQKNAAGYSNFKLAYDGAKRATAAAWRDFYSRLSPEAQKKLESCYK